MAVVKANAYGHGVEALLKGLQVCEQLAVIDIGEAKALRALGLEQEIVILQGANTSAELEWCVANNVSPVVSRLEQAESLAQSAVTSFWFKIDTGMHRLGLSAEELDVAKGILTEAGRVGPYKLMTHFACADEDIAFTELQQQQLKSVAENLPIGALSMANSAAIFDLPSSHEQVVRPGIMLYGASPFANRSAESLGLQPAMSLQAKVVALQRVKAGEGVGYGLTWRATTDSVVAVISAGYGDGVPRNMPAGLPVGIGDIQGETVARVSMDSCFALLPQAGSVQLGETVTLWGTHSNGKIYPVDNVARACGTIGYELLTRVTPRVQRVAV